MADHKDILRIAKYLAQFSKEETISAAAIQLAYGFFQPVEGIAQEAPLTEALLPFGQALLESYQVMPALLLDEEAKTLRIALSKVQIFTFKRASSREKSADEVKALRALVLKDWPTALKTFKPDDPEAAKTFAEKFVRAVSENRKIQRSTLTELEPQKETETTSQAASNVAESSAQNSPSSVQSSAVTSKAPGQITETRRDEITPIYEQLKLYVFDQDAALDELVKELRLREWGLGKDDRPIIFLMVGPAGTGKTLTAQTLVDSGWKEKSLFLNMGSMRSRNEGFALTGLRYGYESAGPGRLTQFVHDVPDALVVLENFTDAHPSVQDLLVSLLTDGTLTDEYGFGSEAKRGKPSTRVVSFQQATIILTTRAGDAVYKSASYRKRLKQDRAGVVAELLTSIEHENLDQAGQGNNRADEDQRASALRGYLGGCRLLPFQPLGLETLTGLAQTAVLALQLRLKGKSIDLLYPGSALQDIALALAFSQGPTIQAMEVQLAASRLLAPDILKALDNSAIKRIEISVDAQGQALLAQSCGNWEKQQSDVFRRNERLEFQLEHRAHVTDTTKTCVFLNTLAFKRVPVQFDQEGDGGISMEVPDIGFDSISGHAHVKDRLREVLKLIQQAPTRTNTPLPPKGMLLYGRPGTGKTMLAKALASEANLPFIAVTGPQLINMRTLRKVFRLARQYAPSLVFIDEIDALGVRGKGGHDEHINQLLSEIDGFVESRDGHIFIVAATNFPQNVDPALTRAGRLDLRMEVPVLDRDARLHFLKELNSFVTDLKPSDLDTVANLTAGMSGADLRKFVREAQLLQFRNPGAPIRSAQLLELLNVIKHGVRLVGAGPLLKEQLEATAYHEAGHAVVSTVLNPHVRIQQVTIVPRGEALGFTAYDPETMQRHSFNRKEVMDLICVALAGRVAESKRFPGPTANADQSISMGGPDSGASSDLRRATDLAWQAITQWGLDEDFGWMSFDALEKPPENWQTKAAQCLEEWMHEAGMHTRQLVDTHWKNIEKMAKALCEKEVLFESDLTALSTGVDIQNFGEE